MQQAPCTSNFHLQGPKTKKIKKRKKQAQWPSYTSHLNKGAENMREQNTKAQEKKCIDIGFEESFLIKFNNSMPFFQ